MHTKIIKFKNFFKQTNQGPILKIPEIRQYWANKPSQFISGSSLYLTTTLQPNIPFTLILNDEYVDNPPNFPALFNCIKKIFDFEQSRNNLLKQLTEPQHFESRKTITSVNMEFIDGGLESFIFKLNCYNKKKVLYNYAISMFRKDNQPYLDGYHNPHKTIKFCERYEQGNATGLNPMAKIFKLFNLTKSETPDGYVAEFLDGYYPIVAIGRMQGSVELGLRRGMALQPLSQQFSANMVEAVVKTSLNISRTLDKGELFAPSIGLGDVMFNPALNQYKFIAFRTYQVTKLQEMAAMTEKVPLHRWIMFKLFS